jgi:hypothetical protein
MKKLALTSILAGLLLVATARAQTPRLTLGQAEREVALWAGPGTTTPRCWRVSRRAIECRYLTPVHNTDIVTNDGTTVWQGWAMARGTNVTSSAAPRDY